MISNELNSQIENRIVIHQKYIIKQSFKIKISKIRINVQYFLYKIFSTFFKDVSLHKNRRWYSSPTTLQSQMLQSPCSLGNKMVY